MALDIPNQMWYIKQPKPVLCIHNLNIRLLRMSLSWGVLNPILDLLDLLDHLDHLDHLDLLDHEYTAIYKIILTFSN
jgi:hypothetical protein